MRPADKRRDCRYGRGPAEPIARSRRPLPRRQVTKSPAEHQSATDPLLHTQTHRCAGTRAFIHSHCARPPTGTDGRAQGSALRALKARPASIQCYQAHQVTELFLEFPYAPAESAKGGAAERGREGNDSKR